MPNPNAISVWIIEDDPEDRDLIAEAFNESADKALTQSLDNALLALERLKRCAASELPDIIITDFNMPVMNGLKFIQSMHEDERYNEITKVVLSTGCQEDDKDKCLRNGATACLTKPDSYGGLIKITQEILALFYNIAKDTK